MEVPTKRASDHALKLAVGCQLVSAAYLQLVEWVPMFPWNNIARGNQQELLDVALGTGQLLVAIAFVRGWRALMWAGTLGYALWLWLQWQSWWQPYLFGGRSVGPRWLFRDTLKFLPPIGDRPTPDANHCLLQLLLLAVLVSAAWVLLNVSAQRRTAVGDPPAR